MQQQQSSHSTDGVRIFLLFCNLFCWLSFWEGCVRIPEIVAVNKILWFLDLVLFKTWYKIKMQVFTDCVLQFDGIFVISRIVHFVDYLAYLARFILTEFLEEILQEGSPWLGQALALTYLSQCCKVFWAFVSLFVILEDSKNASISLSVIRRFCLLILFRIF